MKKLAIADYEAASDKGNMRFYPNGRLIKSLLEKYVTDEVVKYGGSEVETPIMYDSKHPSMASYFNRFPARQYNIDTEGKSMFLRFAACFGQFLMAEGMQISYKNLPYRLYELTRYSFRREQSGELVGLRRLRAFTMPDCHAFCADIDQAVDELGERFDLSRRVISGIGLDSADYEMAIRFTSDFYRDNKNLINSMVSKHGRPVLVEMWKERFFYFVLKWEFNYIDESGKASALSTDQIDVENGERYKIEFIDEQNNKRNPIILHNSPSGAIERVIYALLENAASNSKHGKKPSLPLWLSPTQARIIPVNPEFDSNAQDLAKKLTSDLVRADIDDRDESMGRRVRESEKEWVPYTLVIGEKEAHDGHLSVRDRVTGKTAPMQYEEFLSLLREQTSWYAVCAAKLTDFNIAQTTNNDLRYMKLCSDLCQEIFDRHIYAQLFVYTPCRMHPYMRQTVMEIVMLVQIQSLRTCKTKTRSNISKASIYDSKITAQFHVS